MHVVRVERTSLSRTVTVTGTLAAEEQVMLSLKVTGRLDEVLVDLGSHGAARAGARPPHIH